MFSPHNNDGIVVYLMGLILLILVGVGSTMLMDLTKPLGHQQAELKKQRETITNLQSALLQIDAKLRGLDARERLKQEQIGGLVAQGQILQERITLARHEKQKLEGAITKIEVEFSDYKQTAQVHLRAGSVGRHLGDLVTKSGRVYRSAMIREVTDRGLVIIFENGVTTIVANDLPEPFHEKYQWDTVPRQGSTAVDVPATGADQRPAGRGQELNHREARAAAAAARTKLSETAALQRSLESQLRELERMAATSHSRSAPGSLDTWAYRISKVRAELTKARANYLNARAELARLAPDDSGLRIWQNTE